MTAKNEKNDINKSKKIDINTENTKQENTAEQISTEENTLETLKNQLEALKQKADKNWDLAVRAKAELDNVRKRSEIEVANAHKYALDKFIPELLPILDGLDQGLTTIPEDKQFDSVRAGIELSIKMFDAMLLKFGVEVIDPVNQVFDPNKCEAIAMQKSDDHDNNMVMTVVQKGYSLNQRVIRPARVVVVKN